MARLNKFASVNLNDSYGNPDQRHGGSSSNSSSSTKPRPISTPSGGMLVLTRPGRGQAPQTKPLSGRLGIPSPVNLPSLKREGSAIAPPEAMSISPPVTGWSKTDHLSSSPSPVIGWNSKMDPSPSPPLPASDAADALQKRTFIMHSTESFKPFKPDVYAPPPLRSIQASSSSSAGTTPPPTPPLERKPVIRVEEFPTLQAAVARPPTPPQHGKQKEKKQLQDVKEQQQQQQQQQYGQKKGQDLHGSIPSPQAPLMLRPFGIQEPLSHKTNAFSQSPLPMLYSSSSIYQVNKQGIDNSNEAQSESPFVNSRSEAPKELDSHNLRPQYRTNSPVAYDNAEMRPSSAQSRRDVSPYEKLDIVKPGSDYMVKTSEGRDLKTSSFGKDTYFSKGSPVSREIESRKESAVYEREEYNKEGPVTRYNSHDREGVHREKSFAKEMQHEDPREPNSKGFQDSYSRDWSDNYNRKSSGVHSSHGSRPYSPGQGPHPLYSKRYNQYGSGDYNPPKSSEEHSSSGITGLDPKSSRGLYVEPIDPVRSSESKEYTPQFERTQKTFDSDRQLNYEHKGRESNLKSSDKKEASYDSSQRPLHKKDSSPGMTGRSVVIDTSKKHDDERTPRDDLKKQITQDDEKRKEAARLKLLELEERIARREAEEGKKEHELKDVGDNKPPSVGVPSISEYSSGKDVRQAMQEHHFPQELNDCLLEKERSVIFKTEHMDSKFSQASWGSLSSRGAVEALVAQEPPQGIHSSLSQDRKIVRSRSPTSWRKESGSGPTSKLFSSPYIESGGIRRPNDGGTYKLF